MNTAFLSLPPAAAAQPPSNPADHTLKTYVLLPAMVGGLGSVALQMVQDGGSFLNTPKQETDQTTAELAQAGDKTSLETTLGTEQSQPIIHDFVPSIQIDARLEFLVLVVSSILLGAVVGFIGSILSSDGPPENSSNKPKLAASALMFALFFPSVITALEQNVKAQAEQIKVEAVSELQEEVRNVENQAEQTTESNIQTLEKAANVVQEISENPANRNDNNIEDNLIELEQSLINENKSLAITTDLLERATQAIETIVERGHIAIDSSNENITQYAIQALQDISKNPNALEEIQLIAKTKADLLENHSNSRKAE